MPLAQLTDDGYSRAIWPVHTIVDGDTVFAVATEPAGRTRSDQAGALAADVMATAVLERRRRRPACSHAVRDQRI